MPETCSDGILNNGEVQIDCGGPNCEPCWSVTDCGEQVVNGDFETIDAFGCANNTDSEIHSNATSVQGWYGTTEEAGPQGGITPDYWTISGCGITPNITGTVGPCNSGQGALGFFPAREEVQSQLAAPLVAGQEYCITVDVASSSSGSTADLFFWFHNQTFASGTGIYDLVADNGGAVNIVTGPIGAVPQIVNDPTNIFTNTCQPFTSSFCATGGEEYIVAGGSYATGLAYLIIDNLSVKEACPLTFDSQITASGTPDCAGSCVDLYVETSNQGGGCEVTNDFTFQWYENGVLMAGETNDTLFSACPTATTTYSVEITYSAGCSSITKAENETTITFNCGGCVPPTVTPVVTDETCDGDDDGAIEFTIGGAGTYDIIIDGNVEFDDVAAGTYNWTNQADGTYTVEVVDISDPTCETTINVTINPGTSVTVDSEAATDVTNCTAPDGTVTITSTGGTSYELFTAGGVSVATNATGNFTGLNAGDYYVEVSDGPCGATSAILTINNASAPPAPTAGADATYCVGDPMIDLTVNGTGGTYTWYSDAGLTTVLGTGTTLTPGTTQGATTYYVTETVAGCESPASTVTITINVCCDLDVTTVITDETCDGADDGEVEISITGSGTYNGLVDGVLVAPGLTGPTTQTIPGLSDGTYSIQIVDATDPSCDTTFNITINPGATVPFTTETSTDITDCVNPDGTITVLATGATSYELFTSGGASVTTNTTGNFTGLNAGDYYVVATDGTCTGQSITLTINNASAPAAPTAGTDATYCDGDVLVDMNATAGAGGTLTWYDDAALTNVIGTNPTQAPANTVGTTNYYVTETVAGCESAASTVTITINPIPAAPTAGTDATYCLGDALSDMTATAGSGGVLNWYDDMGLTNNIGNGATQAPANTVGATTYYVTETVNGCESSASTVTITINDAPTITAESATDNTDCVTPNGTVTITSNGTSYELFDAANNSIATNATGAFTGLDVGDYYVVVSNGNCSTTGATLTVGDATITSTNAITANVCDGSTYTFADGTTQTITSNTSYVSTLTNSVGCDSIVTEDITLIQPTTTIIDTTICEGSDYTSQGDAANFVNVLADFQHTSTLTGASGCDSIIIENITVTPIASIDLGIDFSGCIGETITIQANSTSGSILWSTGDTTSSITVTLTADVSYYATVTDQCGTATDTVNITVFPPPIIDAGADVTVPLGATVNLGVTSSTSPIAYQWSPDMFLDCADCADPIASPTGNIMYIVSGTDENGCVGYDTISITVDGEISIYIPNIFSPNGDGENDVFKVYGPSWSTYSMQIFNRWGSLIWESEDPTVNWDGTHKNGEECPQAVFVYKFRGVSVVGQTFERSGNVMLTR